MASKKIVLITGGNTGIGYETVKALLQSSTAYHVLVGSRSVEKGEAAVSELKTAVPESTSSMEVVQVDIHSDESIEAAFQTLSAKLDHIDVLLNNAGATYDPNIHSAHPAPLTLRESYLKTYDVNVAGTQVMTAAFLPLLIKSSDPRLIFVTSGLSTLNGLSQSLMPFHKADIPAGLPKDLSQYPLGYRASKAALNAVMLGWHWILENDGVKTWCVSPGFLATGLGGNPELLKKLGAGDPALGGELITKVIEGERDADVGKVVNRAGIQPW